MGFGMTPCKHYMCLSCFLNIFNSGKLEEVCPVCCMELNSGPYDTEDNYESTDEPSEEPSDRVLYNPVAKALESYTKNTGK